MILFIRADSPEVLIELEQDNVVIATKQWQSGRELSLQINQTIEDLCQRVSKSIANISGIVVYQGPGSYTGLRISISVANALGYSLNIPVAGSTEDDWKKFGKTTLEKTIDFSPISPVYGGQVYTTKPKK